MPSSVFFGMQHLNNNLICAMGYDTTGPDPDLHEIVELCCVPMNHMLDIHPDLILFNMKMQPGGIETIDWKHTRVTRPEMAALMHSGIDRDKIAEYFEMWFDQMNMPNFKGIIPLCHNFPKLRDFLLRWLGWDTYHKIFKEDYRDTMIAAHFINDAADVRAQPLPFSKQELRWVARQLHVENMEQGGSPCDDARTTMLIYKRLLQSK